MEKKSVPDKDDVISSEDLMKQKSVSKKTSESEKGRRAFICSPPDEIYKQNKSCGCFPVKCGLVTISIFTIVLWTFLLLLLIADTYNEYFDWWYVSVMFVIYSPLFVSALLYFMYLSSTIDS